MRFKKALLLIAMNIVTLQPAHAGVKDVVVNGIRVTGESLMDVAVIAHDTCSALLSRVGISKVKTEKITAKERNEIVRYMAMHKPVIQGRSIALLVYFEIRDLVMSHYAVKGQILTDYLFTLFADGDLIYKVKGRYIRLRPSDRTLVIVPSLLTSHVDKVAQDLRFPLIRLR